VSSDADRALDAIARAAMEIGGLLGRLSDVLESGLGDPYPNELTQAQADRLAAHLERVAERGDVILARSMARTQAREGGA
jgi:N-acyl-D-aspartate/D-glutamate deacylase